MEKYIKYSRSGFLFFLICLIAFSFEYSDWGFYAHRRINFFAALTIPPPLNQFFKSQITYLEVHAVDPDRRRYAAEGEGPRHFIDLDRWYEGDSCLLSRDYTTDRMIRGYWEWRENDVVNQVIPEVLKEGRITFRTDRIDFSIDSFALRQEIYAASADSFLMISPFLYPKESGRLFFYDSLTTHGIVPYYVESLYGRLVEAMAVKNLSVVQRICADIGHYVADAHVPLHTTSNYNGQFTDQIGIHAFWESRIPELYETSHFNSLVGRATYIGDIHAFIWNVVGESYNLVGEVLAKEIQARKIVPAQDHYCYEERGNSLVRIQCPELTRAYMELMDGMVEERWMASIRAVGSVWYSAWIDAGQPPLWEGEMEEAANTSLLDRIREKLDFISNDRRWELH